MYKVIFNMIDNDGNICSDCRLTIESEEQLYECRHHKMRRDSVCLARIFEVDDNNNNTRLLRCKLCYGEDGLNSFIIREIERIAICHGMREVF